MVIILVILIIMTIIKITTTVNLEATTIYQVILMTPMQRRR